MSPSLVALVPKSLYLSITFAFGAAGGTELPRTSASLPGLSDSDVDSKEESSPVFEGNEE